MAGEARRGKLACWHVVVVTRWRGGAPDHARRQMTTTVTSDASSSTVSSIRRVDVGSSAEQGSSISSTSGSDGQRPGDAQPLLLAAGERAARLAEAVLDLVPQAGPGQALLDQRVALAARAVPDRLEARTARCRRCSSPGTGWASGTPSRSRVRTSMGRSPGAVDVDAVEEHRAGQRRARHQLVHAVEDPQERRLAAAGRADQRGHPLASISSDTRSSTLWLPNQALTSRGHQFTRPVLGCPQRCVGVSCLDGSGHVLLLLSAGRGGLVPPTTRAITNRTSTSSISTRQPVQARSWTLAVRALGEQLVDEQRQRGLRAVERVGVHQGRTERGGDQRRRLPDRAGNAEDDRGDQTGAGGRQDHRPGGAPLAGARARAMPHAARRAPAAAPPRRCG